MARLYPYGYGSVVVTHAWAGHDNPAVGIHRTARDKGNFQMDIEDSTHAQPSAPDKFAGRDWYYDFRVLCDLDNTACTSVAQRMLQRYANETKAWTPAQNSEWTCRLYMAAKLIMAATLHVNACDFSEDKNLRVVAPYLRYYAVLSLLRAVCYTLPNCKWNDGGLIQMRHAKAIQGAVDHLRKFDTGIADKAEKEIRLLKAERELISYRAPTTGDENVGDRNEFVGLCMLLADVAQFNSELFEVSLLKHADLSTFQLRSSDVEKVAFVEIDGHRFLDGDDLRRLDFFQRKHPHPTNLMFYMKEGHVDDFFLAWGTEDDELPHQFDPDSFIRSIFDIP